MINIFPDEAKEALAALAALESGNEVDFSYMRDLLQVTGGNLGAHLRKLEEAGYITVNKTYVERKPRPYISAISEGREAFQEHVEVLKSILKSK